MSNIFAGHQIEIDKINFMVNINKVIYNHYEWKCQNWNETG